MGLGENVRLVEAASIAELEGFLNQGADWDLVLLDLTMPGAYGFSGLVLLRGQYPHMPVVMISAQEDAAAARALRAWAAASCRAGFRSARAASIRGSCAARGQCLRGP